MVITATNSIVSKILGAVDSDVVGTKSIDNTILLFALSQAIKEYNPFFTNVLTFKGVMYVKIFSLNLYFCHE